jgi:hypothetical protein
MLDRIGRVINNVGLVREMKSDTRWFRARPHARPHSPTASTRNLLGLTIPQSLLFRADHMIQ